jgi:MSHA biogenesis protein MshQ
MNRLAILLSLALALLLSAVSSAWAQIAVRSTAQAGIASGNLVIPKPAGTSTNDVLVAVIANVPANRGFRTPPGWTERISDAGDGSVRLVVLTRVVSASDASVTSYTFELQSGVHTGAVGGIIATIGVDTANPVDTSRIASSPAGFAHAVPSITTTARGALLLTAFTMPGATEDWLPPAGMVEGIDVASTPSRPQASGVALTVTLEARGAAGATGSRTATADSSGIVAAAGRTAAIALRPALAPASTHYRLDGAVGSMASASGEIFDSGGTSLHGRRLTISTPTTTNFVAPNPTIHSQVAAVQGQFCNAASFDGRSVLEVPASNLFDYTTEFSASAWIFPTALPGSGGLSSVLSNDQNYEFHLNSAGRLNWWWGGGDRELTSNSTIPLNRWTHVAITFRSVAGSARQRIYINGVLDSATNSWAGTLTPNGCNFYIGGDVATGAGCSLISDRAFRGLIDEVKLYNFELSSTEVNNDRTLGRACTNPVTRYRIEHDGEAHSCATESITVRSCGNADCTVFATGGATGTVVAGGNSVPFSIPVGQSSTSVSLLLPTTTGLPDPEAVRLGVGSVSPVPSLVPSCRIGAGPVDTTTACDSRVGDVGFVISAPDHVADTVAAATVRALRRSGSGPPDTACSPLFTNVTRSIGFWTSYADPITGTRAVSFGGSTLGSASPGTPVSLAFDASGTATASLRYGDAGAINLQARYVGGAAGDSGLTITGSDRFVTRPARFQLTVAGHDANPALPADATRPVFGVAGAPFNVTVQALNASNVATPNFGREAVPERVQFISSLLAPAGGNNPATAISGFSTWSNGGSSGTVSWPEVGVITLTPELLSAPYLDFSPGANGNVVGTAVERVGRFRPARLAVTPNTPVLANACVAGTFGYIGQPFIFGTEPELVVSGLNAVGAVTRNYDLVVAGASNPFRRFGGGLAGRSYASTATGTGAALSRTTDGGAGVVADVLPPAFDGLARVIVRGDALAWARPLAPAAPFVPRLDLRFSAADLTDSDGVCFDTPALDGCDPLTIAGIVGHAGSQQRWGRVAVTNAFGSELIDLQVPMRAEFFNGTAFVTNTADVCTALTLQPFADPAIFDALMPTETCVQDTGNPGASGRGCAVPGPLPERRYTLTPPVAAGGAYTLWLRAPGAGNVGILDVTPVVPAWLQFDWRGAGNAAPTARVGFGVFQGDRRAIHQREVY